MEHDVDLVIDVEPDEARILVSLIEHLIDVWYVAEDSGRSLMAAVREIAEKKRSLRAVGKSEATSTGQ